MWPLGLLAVLLLCLRVQATKAVFAHFMVENAKTWDENQWAKDIRLAKDAHIDGFALNIRQDDRSFWDSLNRAYSAADSVGGFKMILSFDYAGGGPWGASRVAQTINQFSAYDSYYHEDGKPLVSTFEGPAQASDWKLIKSKTNCMLLPDWSSLGAKQAVAAAPGIIDGLFSWASWPWGNQDSNTYVDASYVEFLEQGGKDSGMDLKFMMPASPWFYTNLPGYKKNWLWRGDDLWFDRWQEIIFLNPDYVEIITWNDFGESHYIGPLYVDGDDYEAFTIGEAPFNYAANMPHDGWRIFLPFVIDLYKKRNATIVNEGLSVWYRPSPAAACGDGMTVGNTASQLLLEFPPAEVAQDKIFFSALLASHQPVTVTVGGVNVAAEWTSQPAYGSGLYHGSASYGGNLGPVVVTVGSMTLNGRDISSSCNDVPGQNGLTNWNAWVGSQSGATVNKEVDISLWVCTEGGAPGAPDFNDLCAFTCRYGYCPPGACYCSSMGPQREKPDSSTPGYGTKGYPGVGRSPSYGGLCSFACDLGYCPSPYCDTVEHPTVLPAVSPFTPDACVSGTGDGDLGGLCSFSCNFGFCPIHSCTCLKTGPLIVPPAAGEKTGKAAEGKDPKLYDDICQFACSRDYCPPGPCVESGNDHVEGNPVYIGTEIFTHPTALCEPPCVLVLPPTTLPNPTTIHIPPYTTSLQVGTTTTTITVTPSDITTTGYGYYNIPVTASKSDGVFNACPSVSVSAVYVTLTYVTDAVTTVSTRKLSLPPWPQITQGPPEQWSSTCAVWGVQDAGATTKSPWTPIPPPPTPTRPTPLPTWTEFPPSVVVPEDDDDGDPEGVVTFSCDGLWFFSFCIDFPELKVPAWKIRLPEGIIGPGPPPPNLIQRDGWTILPKGTLPPWPVITRAPGPNPVINNPEKPQDCRTISQEVEFKTVSEGLSVSNGKTVTTTVSTITRTGYAYGCEVPEYTPTISKCAINKRTDAPAPAPALATAEPRARVSARQPGSLFVNQDDPVNWGNDMNCLGGEANYILYPKGHTDSEVDTIRRRLQMWKGANNFDFYEARSNSLDFTAFFYIQQMPRTMKDNMVWMSQVRLIYDYFDHRKNLASTQPSKPIPRHEEKYATNSTLTELNKRAGITKQHASAWALSQLSTPPGVDWLNRPEFVVNNGNGPEYQYWFDDSAGQGQYIYVLEESFANSPEFTGASTEPEIRVPRYGLNFPDTKQDHGNAVAAAAMGQNLGVAPKATLVPVWMGPVFAHDEIPLETLLHSLLLTAEHIYDNQRQGKAVINMSWGTPAKIYANVEPFVDVMRTILQSLEKNLGAVLVIAAGNSGQDPIKFAAELNYPQRFRWNGDLPSAIVVGAIDKNAKQASLSNWFTGNTPELIWAWGEDVPLANGAGGYNTGSGTSYAAPMVSGLVAYLRALPNPQLANDLTSPSNVLLLLGKLMRTLSINDPNVPSGNMSPPNNIPWNGQFGQSSCLVHPNTQGCPVILSPGGGGGVAAEGDFTFGQGPPSPICTAGCGSYCTGYYCDPKPTGTPPDYVDPALPTSQSPPSTNAGPPAHIIYMYSNYGDSTRAFRWQGLDYHGASGQLPSNLCDTKDSDWAWIDDVTKTWDSKALAKESGISVFGDSCDFVGDTSRTNESRWSGKLTCKKWGDAKCTSGVVGTDQIPPGEKNSCRGPGQGGFSLEWLCTW